MVVYVIIPVYNVEKYLKKCLDSLFNQTYNNYLVICVNDGSTDNSLLILREYEKKYKNMMVIIDKLNGGLSSARNTGLDYIKNFKNSYVTFVDSDDWVSSDYLEVLVKKIEETKVDIVCSSYFDVQESNVNEIDYKSAFFDSVYTSFDALKNLYSGNIQSHSPCKLYKSILWHNIRFDESKCFMEDQVVTFQLFIKSKNILFTDWSGYYYLHRIGSLCQSKMSNKKILSALESYVFNYRYDYSVFCHKQIVVLHEAVIQLFANVFLMMYPRFDKKNATLDELNRWKQIILFEKNNKAVKNFTCQTTKQSIKRWCYLYAKPFYRFFFSFFLKKYDY